MANMGDLMKQAQQLQTKLARIQEEAAMFSV
jgi:DNA-binding protein YbaB